MRKVICLFIFASLLATENISAQGLYNNGAHIVMNGALSNIYIDGANGNYTAVGSATIDPLSTGPTVTLLGNWVNNSNNIGFLYDGSTVVFAGANQNIGGTQFSHFFNVTLSGSGTKTLQQQERVGGFGGVPIGVLSLGSRVLDMNGFDLWEFNPNTTAITYTTGYLQSETNVALNPSQVRWFAGTNMGTYVVPFGVGGSQIPFTIGMTSAMSSSVSYFIISTRATASSLNTPWSSGVTHMYDPTIGGDGSVQAVVDRWWDLTASQAFTANLTFSYRGSENTLIAAYNTGLIGAQYWSSAWLPDNSNIGSGVAVLAGVGSVTAPNVSVAAAYTPWVLSSTLAPLPIELTSFDGACNGAGATVHWTTASETNNAFFTIERSDNGNSFHPVGTIAGSGTTSQSHNYSFTDNDPVLQTTYYRLKQTDYNGVSHTFNVITVEGCGNGDAFNAWASEHDFELEMNIAADGKFLVNITDAAGRLISSDEVYGTEGFNSFRFSHEGLANGIYFLNVTGNNAVYSKKVLVMQ